MEAKELRIGNLVNRDGKNIVINSGYEIDNYEGQYKPIPLTEEWLLKFGFEIKLKLSGHNGFYLNGFYIIKSNYVFELLIEGSSVILSKIKFVHQLQNLYFALTGQELTIKV